MEREPTETRPHDRIVAHFADATHARGDVLLGADGAHSCARQLTDPAAPPPSYTGVLSRSAYNRGAAISPTTDDQHLTFGMRAFFGYLVRENVQTYCFATLPRPNEPRRGELESVSAGARQALPHTFADDDVITQILQNAEGETRAYPVHDLPALRTWHRGPVALLGDLATGCRPTRDRAPRWRARSRSSSPSACASSAAPCRRSPSARTCAANAPRRSTSPQEGSAVRRSPGRKRVIRGLAMPFALKRFANANTHAWMDDYRVDSEAAS